MDDVASTSRDADAFARSRMDASASVSRTQRTRLRRTALLGVGLFGLAWLVGGIGATQGLEELVPYAELSLGLGFVLALFTAVRTGAGWKEVVPIGTLSGVGFFYKGQDHATHVLSGWGFGLDHTAHILLGLVLIGAAILAAASVTFIRTRRATENPGS